MKSFKISPVIIILFLFSFSPSLVLAEIKPGEISLSPHIGGYIYNGAHDANNNIVYGLGLGINITNHWGIEGVINLIDTDSQSRTNDTDIDTSIIRLDALYHLMPDKNLIPYLSAGAGIMNTKDFRGTDTNGILNYGVGIKYFITDSLAIRGDIRHIIELADTRRDNLIDFGSTNNNFAYTVGITYMFGKKPEKTVAVKLTDSDGDGVYDSKDKCPDTPSGVPVNNDGCPSDSDNDGVPDYLDKCPDTPQGMDVDKEGCPVMIKEKVSIDLKVEFAFDSAVIINKYNKNITEVARFLNKYTDTKAVIEGHTCNIGTEEYNLNLSVRRAESVRQRLIELGVEPGRIEIIGYGESRPIADNNTKEGLKRNRRVVSSISTTVTKQ